VREGWGGDQGARRARRMALYSVEAGGPPEDIGMDPLSTATVPRTSGLALERQLASILAADI
jgi:hypothetical protein